ncbi:MAG: DUF4331 family protein [Hyphomicrobiaceae bacterium]
MLKANNMILQIRHWSLLAAFLILVPPNASHASDHVDGPHSIANGATDITDVYAFPVAKRPGHLALILNVHPFADGDTTFSDDVTYTFIVRRARTREVDDHGRSPHFATDGEVRIRCNVDLSKKKANGQAELQHLRCTFDGEKPVTAALNQSEGGAGSATIKRLFAGARSDPFFLDIPSVENKLTLSEQVPTKIAGANTLQDVNVLSLVLELDMRPLFGRHTMFAVAAEISKRGDPTVRFDRVGRSEMTNIFLAQPATVGLHDHDTLKDAYNREATFFISAEAMSRYRDRLFATFYYYDRFDGKLDWRLMPGRMPIVNMLLQDHLVVDIAKPCGGRNANYLEIERAALRDEPHRTCGGRRPNDDVISIINTLLIQGLRMEPDDLIVVGTDAPTKRARKKWPFLVGPNSQLAKAESSTTLPASCRDVWKKIGSFSSLAAWHPGVAKLDVGGKDVGAIRAVFLKNGKLIVEQLSSKDDQLRQYAYRMLSGPLPLTDYRGKLKATASDAGAGCQVVWSSAFKVVGASKQAVTDALKGIYSAGLTNLKTKFGADN